MRRTDNSICRGALGAVVLAVLSVLCISTFGAPAASASLPVYEGGWFPTIHSPADPEEFSWEVTLGEGQELRQIDEEEVAVYYSDGLRSFGIRAEPAHDADGATVPTTIHETGEDVVTLTVHHREGNPVAGGAPFQYPVVDGPGWEGGFHTEIVKGPLDEQELREQQEQQERVAREEHEAAEQQAQDPRCRVPALRGATLAGARTRLHRADCSLGTVAKLRGATAKSGRVIEQTASPGSFLAPGAKVGIKLGSDGGRPGRRAR